MARDYLDRLAEFVTSTNWADLDSSTIFAAEKVVLDTLGAILLGSRMKENANLAQLARDLSGPGRATLIGHEGRVQPVFAALVNATAGVAQEMDEGTRLGGGHPSIHVTPGAIAVGEELGKSGREVLESIIIGYEVTSRVGSGTKVKPEVHSHGTWGTIGAAAATARLLGFDQAQTRQTMNLAMSMSPANTWTPCLEGATIRNLYPGRSGFQGIMAAYLSRCGFTGIKDGPSDLYGGILGESFDQEVVVAGLGERGKFRIQQNYFKLHACCLYNHPVLDAVQNLIDWEGFRGSDVDHVQVEAPPVVQIMTNPEPVSMLSAKFSIPYAVAALVLRGVTDITAFYPEEVAEPSVRALARRVKVTSDPEMTLRRYDYPSARVTVVLKDGRTLRESVTSQHGDFSNPASDEELLAKFARLSFDSLGEERTQMVADTVYRMDELADVRELTSLLGEV
jgi:2-methylcitrate dehydratase PrpD